MAPLPILVSYIATTIVLAVVAISVIAFTPKSKQNVFFFFEIISILAWGISLFLSLPIYPGYTQETLILFARISYGFALLSTFFITLFFYYLGTTVEERENKQNQFKTLSLALFSFENITFFIVTCFTPLVYEGITVTDGTIVDIFGPLYDFWGIQFLIVTIFNLLLLIYKIRKNKGVIRLKLLYTLIAFIILHLSGIVFNLILPSFGNPEYYLLGGISLAPWVIINSFIIVRYRFLGAKLILWKISRFVIECLIVIFTTYALNNLLIQAELLVSYAPYIIVIIGILLFLLLDNVVFANLSNPYNQFKKSIHSLITVTKGAITLPELYALIKSTFQKLGIENIEIFLIEGAVSHVNLPIYPHNELTHYLSETKKEVLTDDIQYQERSHTKKELALLIHLSVLDSRACFPLFHQDRLIGMLHLGKKKNDDPYFAEEIPELRQLADYIASFIVTISLFRQEQQTKIELQRTKELSKTNINVRRMIHDMKNNLSSAHAVIRELKSNSNISSLEKVEEKLHDLEDTLSIDDSGMQRTTVEVYPFLLQLLQGFEDLFKEKKLHYSYSIEAPKDLLCYLDRKKAKSVIENLLYNAYKFTPQGERVFVEIHHFKTNNEALITITNTGVSIPEDLKETIFEEGYTSDHKKGTGTGLHTVRKFVSMSGGEIHECGKVGKNVVFTIKIPLLEPPIHVFHRD